MFLKLLLISSLIVIVATDYLTDITILKLSEVDANSQSKYILPKQYDIIITYYEQENAFVGNCNMSIEILQPLSSINLYVYPKYILGLTVINDPKYHGTKIITYQPMKSLYVNEMHIAKYVYSFNLQGHYIVNIQFLIDMTNADLKDFYGRYNQLWSAAYFDSIAIQRMISCLPESLNTTSAIYNIIIEHNQNFTILSNIPTQKVEINDKNMAMTHLNTTLVIPNYLVFLTNSSLISGKNESIRVDMWCRMYCRFAHDFAENITLYLFHKWERLNETWQMNHVIVPNFEDENLLNKNLVLYRETNIIYNEHVDSVANKIKIARFIAHKVIQQCFLNENPLWSLSFWLNEAIAAFFGSYVINQMLPNTRMMDLFVVQIQHESLHFDTEYNTSLYNTSLFDNSFESPRYIRASCLLRMLQHFISKETLSEKTFWESIRRSVKNNNSSSDYFDEIVKNLESLQTYTTITATFIKQLMNYWINHKYYPVIKVLRDYNNPILFITVWAVNFNTNISLDYLPITLTTQIFYDFTYTNNILLDDKFPYNIIYNYIKENGWILFNVQQTGYYRVNYDFENWRRIANYLNSENYTKIHVLNRAQIIDDTFHLMLTYQLNSIVFWNITRYLTRETDYVAWYPMFKALEYLSNIFLFRETRFFNTMIEIQKLLHGLLEELGYDEVFNEDDLKKSLRMEATKWLCALGNSVCKEKAGHNLRRHLADPEKNKLLPWWNEWTYCQGLKILYYSFNMEDSTWWKIYHLGRQKFIAKFLKFLACPESAQFIENYLNVIKNDSTTSIMFLKDFSDQDYIDYFLSIIARHAKNPVLLTFILRELQNIKPKQISEYAAYTIIINHVSSIEQLKEISDFARDKLISTTEAEFNKYVRTFSDMKRVDVNIDELDRIKKEYSYKQLYIVNILRKIHLRSFEIESQMNYFQNFVVND